SLKTFQTFTSEVKPVTRQHDVYLKFTGIETDILFQIQSLYFVAAGDTSTSSTEPSDSVIPQSFGLEQNFPNPFNPSTRIRFEVPDKSFVSLKVFDLLGREIEELAGKEFFKGEHSVTFDASHLTSGLYFYTLKAKDFLQTKKMFILK
ncbi:T9SS type A sorting domain-containing protein, partial [bacterium]